MNSECVSESAFLSESVLREYTPTKLSAAGRRLLKNEAFAKPDLFSHPNTACRTEASLRSDLPSLSPPLDELAPPLLQHSSPQTSQEGESSEDEDRKDARNRFGSNSLTGSPLEHFGTPDSSIMMQLNSKSVHGEFCCAACGEKPDASITMLTCYMATCRRSFCSTCIPNASVKGVHLINPKTHNCAICQYQLQQRPNLPPHEWHWTFNNHEDLDFTRALRDSLPAVPGLFLEIHASRQACWRRRVGGGVRKHYSFKQHGGFFEGRLQAVQVSFVSHTDLARLMMAVAPGAYHGPVASGPSTRVGKNTMNLSATCSSLTQPMTYPGSMSSYLDVYSQPVEPALFALANYAPPSPALQRLAAAAAVETGRRSSGVAIEQFLSHGKDSSLSQFPGSYRKRKSGDSRENNLTEFSGSKKRSESSDGGAVTESLEARLGNRDAWFNSERKSPRLQASDAGASNRKSTQQAASRDALDGSIYMKSDQDAVAAPSKSNQREAYVGKTSLSNGGLQTKSNPADCFVQDQQLASPIAATGNLLGPLGDGNDQSFPFGGVDMNGSNLPQAGWLSGSGASSVTLRAAYRSRDMLPGGESSDPPDEPRCAICCEYVSRRSDEVSTCSVKSCSRVYCKRCIAEGQITGSEHFVIETNRCAICHYQAGRSQRLLLERPPETWHMNFNLRDDREFLSEYPQRLPPIPGVWFDEATIEWRTGGNASHRGFSPTAHGGLLEARWEATQRLIAS